MLIKSLLLNESHSALSANTRLDGDTKAVLLHVIHENLFKYETHVTLKNREKNKHFYKKN